MLRSLVGSEMCIRDRWGDTLKTKIAGLRQPLQRAELIREMAGMLTLSQADATAALEAAASEAAKKLDHCANQLKNKMESQSQDLLDMSTKVENIQRDGAGFSERVGELAGRADKVVEANRKALNSLRDQIGVTIAEEVSGLKTKLGETVKGMDKIGNSMDAVRQELEASVKSSSASILAQVQVVEQRQGILGASAQQLERLMEDTNTRLAACQARLTETEKRAEEVTGVKLAELAGQVGKVEEVSSQQAASMRAEVAKLEQLRTTKMEAMAGRISEFSSRLDAIKQEMAEQQATGLGKFETLALQLPEVLSRIDDVKRELGQQEVVVQGQGTQLEKLQAEIASNLDGMRTAIEAQGTDAQSQIKILEEMVTVKGEQGETMKASELQVAEARLEAKIGALQDMASSGVEESERRLADTEDKLRKVSRHIMDLAGKLKKQTDAIEGQDEKVMRIVTENTKPLWETLNMMNKRIDVIM
eukprot:TRINITY_DN26570_c0_g1_i2.p1 TRINITY_DN26570_c0_g1~~TRINITY_DN26570_c0_g1_i2.p1  ORF type:complete len:476 (+),score=149.69 TRINITY_DN26570_c0_g1_i2:64-1491(+)